MGNVSTTTSNAVTGALRGHDPDFDAVAANLLGDKPVYSELSGDIIQNMVFLSNVIGGVAEKKKIPYLNIPLQFRDVGGIKSLDFSGDQYQLETLRHLDELGAGDIELRDYIEMVDLDNNRLESLIELSEMAGTSMFLKLLIIKASHNSIRYMCKSEKFPTHHLWPKPMLKLAELHLNHNRLTSIPDLSSMPALSKLHLSHNQIMPTKFRLIAKAPRLVELKLDHNRIDWNRQEFDKDILVFRSMKLLQVIDLRANPFQDIFAQNESKLYVLNQIMRGKGHWSLQLFRQELLDLPGTEGGHMYELDATIVDEADIRNAYSIEAAVDGEEEAPTLSKEPKPPHLELQDINEMVQRALGRPEAALKMIATINKSLHSTLVNNRVAFLVRGKLARDQATITRLVDDILQTLLLLCDRQPELLPGIVETLAIGMGYWEHAFGSKCALQIQSVYNASSVHDLVVETLESVVIAQLTNSALLDTKSRVSLLTGLSAVIDGIPELREPIALNVMEDATHLIHWLRRFDIDWMHGLGDGLDTDSARRRGERRDEFQWAAAVVKFIRVIVSDHAIARIMINPDFHPVRAYLVDVLLGSREHASVTQLRRITAFVDEEKDFLLDFIRIITAGITVDHDPSLRRRVIVRGPFSALLKAGKLSDSEVITSTSFFAEAGIHTMLLRCLVQAIRSVDRCRENAFHIAFVANAVQCLGAFYTFGTVRPDEERARIRDDNLGTAWVGRGKSPNEDLQNHDFRTHLCHIANSDTGSGGGGSGGDASLKLVSIVFHPHIVASAYSVALQILESPTITKAAVKTLTGLLNPVRVLQILGGRLRGTWYREFCKLSNDDGAVNNGIERPLAQMTSATMHELLIAALGLVHYYCHAALDENNVVAGVISSAMNHQKREALLFDCMTVPHDQVKIAAVDCLLAVPTIEYDVGEVALLVQLLATFVSGVGVGETELVVAGLLQLMTRLMLADTDTSRALRENEDAMTSSAVETAFKILRSNIDRDTSDDDEEDQQKFILTQATNDFLRTISLPALRDATLKGINFAMHLHFVLQAEDKYAIDCKPSDDRPWIRKLLKGTKRGSSRRRRHRPTAIELSWLGEDPISVLSCLLGEKIWPDQTPTPVQRGGVVACRVLRRVANTLAGTHPAKEATLVAHTLILAAISSTWRNWPSEKRRRLLESSWTLAHKLSTPTGSGDLRTQEERALSLVNQLHVGHHYTTADAAELGTFGMTNRALVSFEVVVKTKNYAFQQWIDWNEENEQKMFPPGTADQMDRDETEDKAAQDYANHLFVVRSHFVSENGVGKLLRYLSQGITRGIEKAWEPIVRVISDHKKQLVSDLVLGIANHTTRFSNLMTFAEANVVINHPRDYLHAREMHLDEYAAEKVLEADSSRNIWAAMMESVEDTDDDEEEERDMLERDIDDSKILLFHRRIVVSESESSAAVAAGLRIMITLLRLPDVNILNQVLYHVSKPAAVASIVALLFRDEDLHESVSELKEDEGELHWAINPVRCRWFEYNIGAKIMAVLTEIVRIPAHVKIAKPETIKLLAIAAPAVSAALQQLRSIVATLPSRHFMPVDGGGGGKQSFSECEFVLLGATADLAAVIVDAVPDLPMLALEELSAEVGFEVGEERKTRMKNDLIETCFATLFPLRTVIFLLRCLTEDVSVPGFPKEEDAPSRYGEAAVLRIRSMSRVVLRYLQYCRRYRFAVLKAATELEVRSVKFPERSYIADLLKQLAEFRFESVDLSKHLRPGGEVAQRVRDETEATPLCMQVIPKDERIVMHLFGSLIPHRNNTNGFRHSYNVPWAEGLNHEVSAPIRVLLVLTNSRLFMFKTRVPGYTEEGVHADGHNRCLSYFFESENFSQLHEPVPYRLVTQVLHDPAWERVHMSFQIIDCAKENFVFMFQRSDRVREMVHLMGVTRTATDDPHGVGGNGRTRVFADYMADETLNKMLHPRVVGKDKLYNECVVDAMLYEAAVGHFSRRTIVIGNVKNDLHLIVLRPQPRQWLVWQNWKGMEKDVMETHSVALESLTDLAARRDRNQAVQVEVASLRTEEIRFASACNRLELYSDRPMSRKVGGRAVADSPRSASRKKHAAEIFESATSWDLGFIGMQNILTMTFGQLSSPAVHITFLNDDADREEHEMRMIFYSHLDMVRFRSYMSSALG
tara:strand:- start:28 stop:6510 length:6483 start_codon:yes stop_codon:yes gene_type:complete